MNERMQKLAERYDGKLSIYSPINYNVSPDDYDGTEPFHHTWIANEDKPYAVKVAAGQAAWYSSVRPKPIPYQMITGANLPPLLIGYYSGIWAWDFVLKTEYAEKCAEGKEIVEYWQKFFSGRENIHYKMDIPPSFHKLAGGAGIGGHTLQDYSIALDGGLNGIRERIAKAAEANPYQKDWYDAAYIILDGVSGYIKAHSDALRRAAGVVGITNPQGQEWIKMASNCDYIAEGNKPVTFWQACQLFWFLFYLNGHDSPGRIDQYLAPALESELKYGALTLEEAQEITDCLYYKMADHTAYGATIGGLTRDGKDATNPMTWLCLNSIRRLRLTSPRTGLRVHKNTPEELYMAAITALTEGTTFPHMINDEVAVQAMVKRGVKLEDARDYSLCGCGQVMPFGRACGGYEDVIWNCTKTFTATLNDGRDELDGNQVLPRRGTKFATYEELESALLKNMEYTLIFMIQQVNEARRWTANNMSDSLRSLLTHGCIERGLDFRNGGTYYYQGMADALGLTTVANSLAAMKSLVYEKKLVSYDEMISAVETNWECENGENIRRLCLNAPKFGNDDDYADSIMVRLTDYINKVLDTQTTYMGGPWGIDIIGWSGSVMYGAQTGATPDGRKSGQPVADCAGAVQGTDKNGITAHLNSMIKLPHTDTHGPLNLSLKFSPDTVGGEKKDILASLIKTYFAQGGYQAQPSVVSKEQLIMAQQEPEKWRHLIVRVGGFSARFVDLAPEYQADMIARTQY